MGFSLAFEDITFYIRHAFRLGVSLLLISSPFAGHFVADLEIAGLSDTSDFFRSLRSILQFTRRSLAAAKQNNLLRKRAHRLLQTFRWCYQQLDFPWSGRLLVCPTRLTLTLLDNRRQLTLAMQLMQRNPHPRNLRPQLANKLTLLTINILRNQILLREESVKPMTLLPELPLTFPYSFIDALHDLVYIVYAQLQLPGGRGLRVVVMGLLHFLIIQWVVLFFIFMIIMGYWLIGVWNHLRIILDKNRYMKISLVAVSVILALQATTLLYNAQPRFIFHNSLHQISELGRTFTKQQSAPCADCFCYDEEARLALVAFMWAASFLLATGQAVWPAFISQLLWIGLESQLCTDHSLGNFRNFAVQLLILFVLWSHLSCCKSTGSKTLSSADSLASSTYSELSQGTQPGITTKMSKESLITDRSNSIQRTESQASKASTQKSQKESKEDQKKKKNK